MAKLTNNDNETIEIATDEDVYVPIASTDSLGVAQFDPNDFAVSQDGVVSALSKVGGIQYMGTIVSQSDDGSILTWQLSDASDGDLERPKIGDKVLSISLFADGDTVVPAGSVFVITNVDNYDVTECTPVYTDTTALLTLTLTSTSTIVSITNSNDDGVNAVYTFTLASGNTFDVTVSDGVGISGIEKTKTEDLVDTYTITFTDGTTYDFNVTNGKDDVAEYIQSIELTDTSGLVDTYTITTTTGNTYTFTVTNADSYADIIFDTAIIIGGNIDTDAINATNIGGSYSNDANQGGSYYRINIGVGNTYLSDDADYRDAVVVGSKNTFTTDSYTTVCVGSRNTVAGNYNVVIGKGIQAEGEHIIAIGQVSATNAEKSVVMGTDCYVDNKYTVVIGRAITTSDCAYSIILCTNDTNKSYSNVSNSVIMGRSNTVTGGSNSEDELQTDYDVVIGCDNKLAGANSVVIGYSNTASEENDYTIMIGGNNYADTESITIGYGNQSDIGDNMVSYPVVIGYENNVPSDYAVVIGYNNIYNYAYSNAILIGRDNTMTSYSSIILGCNCTIDDEYKVGNNVLVGYNSTITGGDVTAVGVRSAANYNFAVAMGFNSTADGLSSVAVGPSTYAGNYAVALGTHSNATTQLSIAIGAEALSEGNSSIVVGALATASYDYSVAIGWGVATSGAHQVQIGTSDESVYLGSAGPYGSSDERDKIDFEDYDDDVSLQFITSLHTFSYRNNHRELYEYTTTDEDGNEVPTDEHKKYGLGLYDKEAHALGTKKGTRRRSGVSAQDVTARMKEYFGDEDYVHLVNDSLYEHIQAGEEIPEGVESKKTVNYVEFIPFLISAIRAQQKQIEALQSEIEELKNS